MGHRNPQGLLNLKGNIYSVEHGPKGGDEINLIKFGRNYGWPLYSLGSKYSGSAYHAMGSMSFFEPPLYAFTPSIGISNITSCPKSLNARYEPLSCILISSLRANAIFVVLIEPEKQKVLSVECVNVGMRVREFYLNEFNNNIYIISDDIGVYKLNFEHVSNFF